MNQKNVLYLKRILFVLAILSALVIAFICLNYYIGYFGYNKHLVKRYSQSVEESLARNRFIEKLKYKCDSVEIENIFIEKAYKWGFTDNQTRDLKMNDTYSENQPDLQYQIVIIFNEEQKSQLVAIPDNRLKLKDSCLKADLKLPVYLRDVNDKLPHIDTLTIFRSRNILDYNPL
nr:hypothetical protein [Bacteroidota bacterium]